VQGVAGSNPVSPTFYLASGSCEQFTKSLLNAFLKSRGAGTSPQTIEFYHHALDRLIGHPLTPEGINAYLNSLRCGNAKYNYYQRIKTICTWLYKSGQLTTNPADRVLPPRRQKKLLPAISNEQLDTLLSHCRCERDKALISLLWYSGMRITEAINVKAGDFSDGTVIVLGKGNKYRKCLAGNALVKQWFSEHDDFDITRAGVQTMLKRLAKETGIHCNPHSFRRGFAVHQVKQGLSTRVVQVLGGWESIAMVERYTKSLSFEDALSAYRVVNDSSL
jgi:site-specific recombinase XerD